MTPRRLCQVAALIAACAGCARTQPQVDALIARIGEQTGHTEGYPRQIFDIDQHDPARSLIALPHADVNERVRDALAHRGTRWLAVETNASWCGRSEEYTLTRGDALVCVLRITGGRREADLLASIIREWSVRMSALRRPDGDVEDEGAFRRCLGHEVIAYWAYAAISDRLGTKPVELNRLEVP